MNKGIVPVVETEKSNECIVLSSKLILHVHDYRYGLKSTGSHEQDSVGLVRGHEQDSLGLVRGKW